MNEPRDNWPADDPDEQQQLEEDVAEILRLPESEQARAFEGLRSKHPEHAELLRRWELAAGAIRTNVDASGIAGAMQGELSAAKPPDPIDGYDIESVLGEGGMGTVYLATQLEPVRRQVALKVVKLGMDTRQILARFELERRTLALMNHDAIAKVYDAGQTTTGQPFFAMEYVPGTPLTAHCDQYRLTVRDRIELFRRVCRGVQHAHQKGVIHRDLKPGNLLVVRDADRSAPKIIDFGLARALDDEQLVKTVHGEHGQFVGTPEYMAPEQAGFDREKIDTRTDVYSLGVTLYEVLTGELPFSSEELREGDYADLSRKLRDTEPAKPSTRIDTRSDSSQAAARHRRTSLPALSRQLRGDLDWIVLKAMAKEPERRYSSASELELDLGRFLAHQPVEAGPPGSWYRLQKLIRRNRLQFVAATSVLIALIGGIVGTLFGLFEAWAQQARVQTEATTATRVADFMVDMFEVSNPSESRGNSITAREILDKSASKIDDLTDQPRVRARLQKSMGDVYRNLGLYEQAEPLLTMSLETRRRELGDDHAETLRSIDALGKLAWDRERHAEAARYHSEALEGRRRTLGDEDPETLSSMNNYALALRDLGQLDEAESWLRRALDGRRRVLGDEHERTLVSISNMAQILRAQGRGDEAAPLYREALDVGRRVQGDDHPQTLNTINDVAVMRHGARDYVEAEKLYREALAGNRSVRGDDHRETLTTIGNLGQLFVDQGKLDAAEPFWLECLEGRRRVLGNDADGTLRAIEAMAFLRLRQGKHEPAAALFREAVATRRRTHGDADPKTLGAIRSLALFLRFTRQSAEAEPLFVEIAETRARTQGEDHRDTIAAQADLGQVWVGLRRYDEAEQVLRSSVGKMREQQVPAARVAIYGRFLAECQFQLKRYEDAEQNWLAAHDAFGSKYGQTGTQTVLVVRSLVGLYEAWDKPERAAEWRARLPAKQPR